MTPGKLFDFSKIKQEFSSGKKDGSNNGYKDFPGGSVVKNPLANAGDMGLIPGSGRSPGVENGNPTPVFFSGKSHGQRSLARYSPWYHKELDTI